MNTTNSRMNSRVKRTTSLHQNNQQHTNLNRSFRMGGSLAEQNQVRSFNRPRINKSMAPSQPHRIELPLFFNTPSRHLDAQNGRPARLAKTMSQYNTTGQQQLQSQPQQKVDSAIYITTIRRLKDYEMLAFGCRRAGKVRDQGRSYYSIGVLFDNIKKHKKAVQYYLKFLQVCKSINDSHGEALAYNCIAVDYQLMGEQNSDFTKQAIQYHLLHEQLADVNGKFLASINLGLCYERLQDQKNSIFYFQNALKYSIQMSNLSGQSLAVGNIGRIGTKQLSENKDKMKIFVEKYLKLSEQMQDQKGQMQGNLKLGMISSTKKNYQEGKQQFRKALELAQDSGNKQYFNQAKFGYAIVSGQKGMNGYIGSFNQKLMSTKKY